MDEYNISKHRYYELKHACLQYPEWINKETPENEEKIKLLNETAYEACMHAFWYPMLISAVTEGIKYEGIILKYGIAPVKKDVWITYYRYFFYLLDQKWF